MNYIRNNNNYSDEDIFQRYDDLIFDVINDEIYKKKKNLIILIRDILNCGVKERDFDVIRFLICKVKDIRNQDVSGELAEHPELRISSNKAIIRVLLKEYFPEYGIDEINYDDYDDEEYAYSPADRNDGHILAKRK